MDGPQDLDAEFWQHYDRNRDDAGSLRGRLVGCFGAGATGSHMAALIGHCGCDLEVVDPDTLTRENLTRHYITDPAMLGHPKALALAETLRRELPRVQHVRGIVADIRQFDDGALGQLISRYELLVDATGSDEVGRRMQPRCRDLGTPLVVPSLWPEDSPIVGDFLVVPSPSFAQSACFTCLHPETDAVAALEAQRGLGVEVQTVALAASQAVLALLLPNTPRNSWLMGHLQAGRNLFAVQRTPPATAAIRTHRRTDCPDCVGSDVVAGVLAAPPDTWLPWLVVACLLLSAATPIFWWLLLVAVVVLGGVLYTRVITPGQLWTFSLRFFRRP